MITLDTPLYLSSITYNYYQQPFWDKLRPELDSSGQFIIDMGKKFKPNRSFARKGEWSHPFPQIVPPMFTMPTYDPNYSKTFDEITDLRALEIKDYINNFNHKFAIMFSGGIDSTLMMSALLKNLNEQEFKNVAICYNVQTLIENPNFFVKYIQGKFQTFDSSVVKYDDLIEKGYRPITGDEGDSIFGTMLGHGLFQDYAFFLEKVSTQSRSHLESIRDKVTSADVHWSEYKDLIIAHLGMPDTPQFGETIYEKIVKNINSVDIPVQSLHDFYWWIIFNLKYINCATRIAFVLNDRIHCKDVFEKHSVNWFNSKDYQQWSMVNNNNGEKINKSIATYKMAARRYIYDLDRNDWYFHFKLKIGSLGPNVVYNQPVDHIPLEQRPNARFGLDLEYNTLYIDDPDVQSYIKYHLSNFKRDW